MSTSSAITSDIVVQWNHSVEERGLNQSVILQLENARWLKRLPASWNPWEPQYEEDTDNKREFSRAISNPSQRQFFRFSSDKTVTIKMETLPGGVSENFTITSNRHNRCSRHMVIELYCEKAVLSYSLDDPTTFEKLTNTFSRVTGIAQNVSQNAYSVLASVPNALAITATKVGATASKVIYG